MRYAALLRGVNVGTAKRVPMAGLRALVAGLGGTEVGTLLGSGNVVFTHARTSTQTLALLAPVARESWGREKLSVGSRSAYLWCSDGVAASRLWKAVNQALGGDVTSRNWDTILKLQALV